MWTFLLKKESSRLVSKVFSLTPCVTPRGSNLKEGITFDLAHFYGSFRIIKCKLKCPSHCKRPLHEVAHGGGISFILEKNDLSNQRPFYLPPTAYDGFKTAVRRFASLWRLEKPRLKEKVCIDFCLGKKSNYFVLWNLCNTGQGSNVANWNGFTKYDLYIVFFLLLLFVVCFCKVIPSINGMQVKSLLLWLPVY